VWAEVEPAFTTAFREFQLGVLDLRTTRHLVANLLTDTAPAVLPDFLEVADNCAATDAWAGKAADPAR